MKAKLLPLIAVLILGAPRAFGQEQATLPAKADSAPAYDETDQGSPSKRRIQGDSPRYGSDARKSDGANRAPSNDREKPAEKPAGSVPEEISRWIKQLDSDE